MGALAAIGEGLVELGLEADEDAVEFGYGGDAANLCVMAARLGAPVRLVGRIGRDPLGARLERFWRRAGIDLRGLRIDAAPTGLYVNESLPGGHRFSYWRRESAGSRLTSDDLPLPVFDGLSLFAATGVTLAISASAARAAFHGAELARSAGAGVACVLNHRPALSGDARLIRRFAAGCDVVIGSREDAEALFGTGDVGTLAGEHLPGVGEVVLTDGARPVTFRAGGQAGEQAVPHVHVRNAGGAGDAFAGAYLARRVEQDDVAAAVVWGVAAATLSVARAGCAASYPTLDETAALVGTLAAAGTVRCAT